MPFTVQEIEQALLPQHTGYWPELSKIKASPNYVIIEDYLTGKSNSLQGLQYDNLVYYIGPLVNLLKNPEQPTADDQLVLDIINEPAMSSIRWYYINRLMLHALEQGTNSSLNLAVSNLRQANYSDDQIFLYMMGFYGKEYTPDNLSLDNNKPIKTLLLGYVKSSRQLWLPSQSIGPSDWSFLYFRLLEEEGRPDWVIGYAFQAVFVRRPKPLLMLAEYRNGFYLPKILEFLQDQQNSNLGTIQAKYQAAITFYEKDEATYKNLAVTMAHQYLDYRRVFGYDNLRWESGCQLMSIDDMRLQYPNFLSLSIHLLLKYERENAFKEVNELFEKKIFFPFTVLLFLYYHLKQDALPYVLRTMEAGNGDVDFYKAVFNLLKENFQPQEYLEHIWKMVSNKSKPMKELIASTLHELDADAETKAIALLENKNSETRQTAALILSRFSTSTAIEAIHKVLGKESNDTARDVLLQTVADSLPQEASREFIDGIIAAAKQRGKLNKPAETWLDENELPPLFYKDGTQLSIEAVRFLLYRMSRVNTMRSDIEARMLLQHIDKQSSAEFGMHLMKLYLAKEAKPEHKYFMAVAALLGDDAVVDKIRSTINNWIDNNRAKMAEHGVGALALQGSDKALRWVEWYSRKYKNKKANVGQAATQALEDAAQELQITTHELGDRVVPDFGFDGLFRHFKIGNEEYRAFIDSNFKLAFFNEDNKKLKSLPAAADAELKDEFKNIAKEVRDVVKSQSSRLEHYLVVQRRWTAAQWQQFFLNNPIMFIYATKLLWGIYENGQLTQCFLCQEDTTLVNENDDEVSLPDEAMIGIVHPLQLSAEQLQVWRRKFFDASIEPIFPQLERPFSILEDEEKDNGIVRKFIGLKSDSAAVRGTLEKNGWTKATGDGGHIDFFTYTDHASHIRAVLETEGIFVYFTADQEAKLGRLFFIDTKKEKSRWYNTPKDDKDERLMRLGELSPVFYSEVMSIIGNIKAKD